MAITISGSGITSANIADGTIVNADVNDVAASKLTGTVADANIAGMSASKLTGALPAISGASLTNLPGGGKVLQVVELISSGRTSTSSTSFVSTSITKAITPSSTSSKILVLISTAGYTGSGGSHLYYTVYRGSTELADSSNGMGEVYSSGNRIIAPINISYLDSPSSVSSVSYTLYFRVSSATAEIPPEITTAWNITLMEIGE